MQTSLSTASRYSNRYYSAYYAHTQYKPLYVYEVHSPLSRISSLWKSNLDNQLGPAEKIHALKQASYTISGAKKKITQIARL